MNLSFLLIISLNLFDLIFNEFKKLIICLILFHRLSHPYKFDVLLSKKQVISRVLFILIMGNHLSRTGITSQPQAALLSRFLNGHKSLLPAGVYLANTSQCCWCALTAPLPLPYLKVLAVCCGTILAVTTGSNQA